MVLKLELGGDMAESDRVTPWSPKTFNTFVKMIEQSLKIKKWCFMNLKS